MTTTNMFIQNIKEFFSIMLEYAPKFLPAVNLTLQLSIFSIILGTLVGLIVTVMKRSKLKVLSKIANGYISVIRGTPLLLQLFFIFFVLPDLGIIISPFLSAVIGLALHSGAYISEIFRGAIESIHYGQREAALALGMTKQQTFIHVILPQAFKISVPALGNQFITAVKDSSLASVVTITETMLAARQFQSATYASTPIFLLAGLYYYVIITILSKLLIVLERRLKVNER
jgi:polar amino acid transport system permease protein